MELSKQEMELFLLFPDLQSKNFFYKMFLILTNESRTGFENRKWKYPNRKWNYFFYFLTSDQNNMFLAFINEFKTGFENKKWNYPNRKWNFFSYFQTLDQTSTRIVHRYVKLI